MNKMSVGFRKSFLGFNCEDVMYYIEDSHKSFMKKEEELNGKISELNKTVSDLSSDIEDLNKTNEALQDKVKEYTSKQDEIERLSQNIGKLYLVAQSNAKAIVKNSVDSIGIASNEVNKNIDSIDLTHKALDELKEKILEMSTQFIKNTDELCESLNAAKEMLTDKDNSTNEHINDFESLYAEITK